MPYVKRRTAANMDTDTASILRCSVNIQSWCESPAKYLSRWSRSNVETPALCTVPETKDDLAQVLQYARDKGLTIVVEGGGNASFVPITENTLYVRMKSFDTLQVDEMKRIATIGGGVQTGQLLRFLASRGFYTVLPSSNAVGIVGFALGGGGRCVTNSGAESKHHFIGMHGLAADNVTSVTIMTADGKSRQVNNACLGEELALFEALNGAGFGFGIVTSISMKVYPLSNLRMENDKFLTRRLIFPGSARNAAAKAFASFSSVSRELTIALVCARAPETMPHPNEPMLVLTASYIGPREAGMEQLAALFDDALIAASIMAETVMEPFIHLNDPTVGSNASTKDFKDLNVASLQTVSEHTIQEVYRKWYVFTSANTDAKKTTFVFSRFNTSFPEESRQPGKFIGTRDRGTAFIAMTWFTDANIRGKVESFALDLKHTVTEQDTGVSRTVVNNMRPHTRASELFDDHDSILELGRLKGVWDPENLFWSPWLRGRQSKA